MSWSLSTPSVDSGDWEPSPCRPGLRPPPGRFSLHLLLRPEPPTDLARTFCCSCTPDEFELDFDLDFFFWVGGGVWSLFLTNLFCSLGEVGQERLRRNGATHPRW